MCEVGHEFGPQRHFDPLENFLLDRLHAQHAHDDVEGEFVRQNREKAGGVLWPDLRQNDRNGLRVFVLQIVGEHFFLNVGELLPDIASRRTTDFFHDGVDFVLRQNAGQHALGDIVIAGEGAG